MNAFVAEVVKTMQRRLILLAAAVLVFGLVPGAATAHRVNDGLEIRVVRAPVAPDGTTAGAVLDFVVSFADPNPAVPGVGMKNGGTVTVELDDAFELPAAPGTAIILQGWPQSPRVPFPYTTDVAGNTITLTLTDDWAVGDFGPGPKAVHLALLASHNPAKAGRYDVSVSIQPDPASGDTLAGHGHVQIIPKVRPNVNVVSLFSGPPGPPPPFFNPLFQDVTAGDSGHPVGMYLWERGGDPALGVDVEMTNGRHGRLVQDGRTIGHVRIRAPHGAEAHTLTTTGPSVETPAFVTGIPTGLLLTEFTPDPAVTGEYSVTFRMNGGNAQTMHYHVTS